MRLATLLAISFLAGAASFFAVYHWSTPAGAQMTVCESKAVQWLQERFQLEPEHAMAVEKALRTYGKTCGNMSVRIAANQRELCRLIRNSNEITPELRETLEESGRLYTKSRILLLQHAYTVGAMMPEDGCGDYLDWVADRVVKTPTVELAVQNP